MGLHKIPFILNVTCGDYLDISHQLIRWHHFSGKVAKHVPVLKYFKSVR